VEVGGPDPGGVGAALRPFHLVSEVV
jgi:hypothetical protein